MITYRGERVDGGMVEGQYLEWLGQSFITDYIHDRCDGTLEVDSFPVHPDSLAIGDTNLKDKNGKVIFASFEYEEGKMSRGGDILGGGFKNRDVIWKNGSLQIRDFCPLYDDGGMLEIIGNAWSNPELLEKK
jgi:hypothetical protein